MDADIIDLHRRAVRGFRDRVGAVGGDAWGRPTPCLDWNVHDLVNHVVGEDRWTVPLLEGKTIAQVGDVFDGDLLGDEPRQAAWEAMDEAVAAFAVPGVLDRTVHLSFGDAPAEEYAWQLFADHLIHTWDLAVATDGDDRLDPRLVDACAEWFGPMEEMYRQAGVIGIRPDLPADADAQARLLAAFGRESRWATPG
ncbi:MAG TPA: TIGR03086 family metal-binding protein [Streptosporangiaceae bacterium]|nr:TIGR03086 family metal-binding protein [Streptosporangiaceae bacterium]